MSVTVRVDDTPEWNVTGYSVTEDSSPTSVFDSTGGYGTLSATVPEKSRHKFARGKVLAIEDTGRGKTEGVIGNPSGNGVSATLNADSRLGRMNADRTAQPYHGTLDGALRYYLGLVGITERIVVEDDIATLPVTFVGWHGNVFDQVNKKLCPALGIEMSLASTDVVFRRPRQFNSVTYRDISRSWSQDDSQMAQKVTLSYNPTEYKERGLVYPAGGWNDEVRIFSVDAGEVLEETIDLGASVESIEQPVCVERVGPNDAEASVYTVSGGDGLPIKPAQWQEWGGSLTVEILEDTKTAKVTVRGPVRDQYAPYQIAMSSGTSDTYSSLRIVGKGVFFAEETLSWTTGATADQTSDEDGPEVENEFVTSYAQAQGALARALADFSSPRQAMQVTTRGINRVGDANVYTYATVDEFDAEYGDLTVDEFDLLMQNLTVDELDATWADKHKDEYENQAFGNVAGSRVMAEDGSAFFRIRTATASGTWSYTAEFDTIVDDFDKAWGHLTVDEFDALWGDHVVADLDVSPLALPES